MFELLFVTFNQTKGMSIPIAVIEVPDETEAYQREKVRSRKEQTLKFCVFFNLLDTRGIGNNRNRRA